MRDRRWLISSLALVCGGCGSAATLGFRGTIPAERRHPVEKVLAPGASLRFPDAQPFNVHDKLSAQTPGSNGKAQGEADAQTDGHASCAATAENGGTAWGRFQLGHCLDNRTGQPMTADVELDVTYEVQANVPRASDETVADNSPALAASPEANITLRAVVKDSDEVILRTVNFAALTNDLGPLGKSARETPRFSIEMQPDLAYTLALVGQAEVTTTEGTQATANVTIRSLSITVTGRP